MAAMRIGVALLVTVVAVGAYLSRPAPVAVDVGVGPEPAEPTAVACPVRVDRSGRGRLDIVSARSGPVTVSSFAAGTETQSVQVAVDQAGSGSVPLADLTAGGLVATLIELEELEAAAAVTQLGEGGTASLPCTPPVVDTALIPGASTRSEEATELQLLNPYAVDAVVSVTSSSEAGIDSASELEEVLVPARSVLTRDLATLLPLRMSLAVNLRVDRGAVHGAVAQAGQGDRMLLPAAAPATEWWIPLPTLGGAPRAIEIATALPAPVEVEVTAYGGPDGPTTRGFTVPAEALTEIPVAELGEGVTGVSVAAASPVVATLTLEGEAIRAGSPGVSELSTRWLVPAVTAGSSGSLWILNPTEVDVEVVTQPVAAGVRAQREVVPAGQAIRIPLDTQGSGYLVQATGEVAVVGSLSGATGAELARATPVVVTTAEGEDGG